MKLPVLLAALLFVLSGPALAQDASADEAAAPAPAAAESSAPAAATQAPQFYQTGIQMGTTYCPEASYDCGLAGTSEKDIVNAANTCIHTRFNIPDDIMSEFKTSGQYENCVLPSRASNAGGGSTWAVCCIKKSSQEQCNLFCTRYINNNK